uniref:hypothetical protein n=1 Tax=Microbispora cellulosiformans TaxID=2614688 RepID=UPI002982694F|nr:hypothetical protein [Microbispora cellulosiformans]
MRFPIRPRYTPARRVVREYAAPGVDEFVLSGRPHLEEACRVGEYVLPRLRSAEPAAAHAGYGAY